MDDVAAEIQLTGFQLKSLEKILKLFPPDVNLVFGGEYLWLYTNYLNIRIPSFGVRLEDVGVRVGDMMSFTSVVREEEYKVLVQREKLVFEGESRKVTLGLRYEPCCFGRAEEDREDREVRTGFQFDIRTMVRLSKYCSIQLVDLFSLVWLQEDGYYAGTGSIVAHVPGEFGGLPFGIGFPKFILVGLETLLTDEGEECIIDKDMRKLTTKVIVEGIGEVDVEARVVRAEKLFSREMFNLQGVVAEIGFTAEEVEVLKKIVSRDTVVNVRYSKGEGLCLQFRKGDMVWEERSGEVDSVGDDFQFQVDGVDFRTMLEECSSFQYDGKKLKGVGEDIEVVCGTLT